jgi:hypothetical protein
MLQLKVLLITTLHPISGKGIITGALTRPQIILLKQLLVNTKHLLAIIIIKAKGSVLEGSSFGLSLFFLSWVDWVAGAEAGVEWFHAGVMVVFLPVGYWEVYWVVCHRVVEEEVAVDGLAAVEALVDLEVAAVVVVAPAAVGNIGRCVVKTKINSTAPDILRGCFLC